MWLLLWPQHLCFDWSHDVVPLISEWNDRSNVLTAAAVILFLLVCVLILIQLVVIMKHGVRRDSNVVSSGLCIGLVLLVVPFLPSCNLMFPVGFTVAERVMSVISVCGSCVTAFCAGIRRLWGSASWQLKRLHG